MGKSAQLQNLLQGYQCNQLSSNFCAYFITISGNTSGDKVGQARTVAGYQCASANWNDLRFLRYEERIVPVRASALIPPQRLRAHPTLSPEVFPEIVIK